MIVETVSMISSAVSSVAAVILACLAWVALKKYKSDKWWERRVESYLKVLDALADTKSYYNRELRAEATQSEAPPEQIKNLAERAQGAEQVIQKAIDMAELFISKEAHQRLIEYQIDSASTNRPVDDNGVLTSWVDHVIARLDAITTCQADMIKIAKKDLELPKF
ncbi:MAG: hypothetical protein OXN16_12695 [Gammaproteobacteria bacterium]|nr:hypothetical protein [Gammaproteobacteria bacterium]